MVARLACADREERAREGVKRGQVRMQAQPWLEQEDEARKSGKASISSRSFCCSHGISDGGVGGAAAAGGSMSQNTQKHGMKGRERERTGQTLSCLHSLPQTWSERDTADHRTRRLSFSLAFQGKHNDCRFCVYSNSSRRTATVTVTARRRRQRKLRHAHKNTRGKRFQGNKGECLSGS